MAETATAGAQVALRFDIVADPTQFKSAVSEARETWRSAAADMRAEGGDVGARMSDAFKGLGDIALNAASEINAAFNEGAEGVQALTVKGFDAVKKGAEGLIDYAGSFGERWFGRIGKIGGEYLASTLKQYIEPAAGEVAGWLHRAFQTDTLQSWTAGVASLAAGFDNLTGSIIGLEERVNSAVDGVRKGLAEVAGAERVLGRFFSPGQDSDELKTKTDAIDAQIAKWKEMAEAIGQTTAAQARARVMALETDDASMAQRALIAAKAREAFEAAAGLEAAKAAEAQRKEWDGVTMALARQVELARAKANEEGKTAGQIAAERAEVEAITRMRQRGHEMTDAELDLLQDQTMELERQVDLATRRSAERQVSMGLERQRAGLEAEAATLGMSAEAAAAYKAELAAVAKLKEANITVSDEMRDRIEAEAQAIGKAAGETARMREAFETLRSAGQIATRSLEGVFDKFIHGQTIKWREMVDAMIADLARLAFRQAILAPIFGGTGGSGLLGSLFSGLVGGPAAGAGAWATSVIPARAEGGPVSSGMPYLVGERGPELFVPGSAGTVVPNEAMNGRQVNMAMTINLAGANGDETIARIAAQAARQGAMAAVQQSSENFAARQRQLQLLGA